MEDNQPVDILAVAAGNPAQAVPGQKREFAMVGGTVDRNKKKRNKKPKVSQGPVIPKNALMQLNEIKPGLVYNVGDHEGPVHNPVFRCTVEVNGQMFEGKGVSKKKAKLDAAEKALNSFVQLPSSTVTTTPAAESGDFMSDQGEGSGFSNFDEAKKETNGSNTSGLPNVPMGGIPLEKPQNKSPVMVLNELKPGTQYSFVSETGEHHSKCFTMEVVVNDKKFQGEGRSKKLAKARAAQLALKECFNIDFDTQPGGAQVLPVAGEHADDSASVAAPVAKPSLNADPIASLVINKFHELTAGTPNARRKVLAGFVLTRGDGFEVVSLATGTKCVNGEYMSGRGLTLNDCHAEVLARRGLKQYFYDQLRLHTKDGDENSAELSIFQKKEGGGFQLKPDISVHLYISTSPCGDARIFSPHESEAGSVTDNHPNRKARGQLRTKIESGEGTIPVKSKLGIQTWDGIMSGERLLTMSCSDKIARWNVLGLQGSLLTHFVQPIYLKSVILGSFYHGEHLSRAVYGRLGMVPDLPEGFHHVCPMLSGILNKELRLPSKAPSTAVNWVKTLEGLEVVNTWKGKTQSNSASRLCKYRLFKEYQDLCNQFGLTNPPDCYAEAKEAMTVYNQVKRSLIGRFQELGFGAWVTKPLEEDLFGLDEGQEQELMAEGKQEVSKKKNKEKLKQGGGGMQEATVGIHGSFLDQSAVTPETKQEVKVIPDDDVEMKESK